MADYPNFAGEAQFKDTASVPTPPANNLSLYSDGGVLKTKNSSGTVTTLGVDLASPSAIGSTTPNTGAFTTLSFAPAANATGLSSSSYSLTGSNAQSLVSLTGTWNTTGTPSAILLNITDTASNANSNLINLQTGGTTRFRVDKSSNVFASAFYVNASFNAQFTGFYGIFNGSTEIAAFSSSTNVGLNVRGTLPIGFCSGAPSGTDNDVRLNRDAAHILALRYTTNAQTFRIYNTFTDASNYERGFLRWASNVFEIGAEAAGTGTLRGLKIGTATTSLIGFYGVTPVDQPATVTDPTGGLTVDAEARTAINAIIDRLQELGLIA